MSNNSMKKICICTLIVLLCVISVFVLGNTFSQPDKYTYISESIDQQIESVQKLSIMATLTSTAISAMPDDTATPVAEKLADFTEYFLIILAVLYLEKYAMPLVLGLGIFKILIPIIGIILIIAVIYNSKFFYTLAAKTAVISVAIALIIPVSVKASDSIYNSCGDKINNLVTESEQLSNDANVIAESESAGKIIGAISEAVNTILNKASNIISRLIETTAVMIVASCAVPILIILLFIWIINLIIGKDTIRVITPANLPKSKV